MHEKKTDEISVPHVLNMSIVQQAELRQLYEK